MKLTDDFSNNVDSLTFDTDTMDNAYTKYIFAIIVLSTTMLATWMLGELFSVGGFTSMEIALLVLFSSTFLRFAAAFWNVVIDFAGNVLASQQ